MAKMIITGLDDFMVKMSKLEDGGTMKAAKFAVYDGARVIADYLEEKVQALPCVSDAEALQRYHKKEPAQLSYKQKQGLLQGMGIASMRETTGTVETKVGFDGYNEVVTKRWPDGQPNIMIARAIESGTSFMRKTPFVRATADQAKDKARAKMQETFERIIQEIGG